MGGNGATFFRRSPTSLVVEQTTEILNHASVDELANRIEEMHDDISAFRTEYGVGSPEELAIDRANQTLSGDGSSREVDQETIREWQTTRRNLAFANAALSLSNAERIVDEDARSTGGGAKPE
jgi:hypothetical protein